MKRLISIMLSLLMLPLAACKAGEPADSGAKDPEPSPTAETDTRLTPPNAEDMTELEKLFTELGYEYWVIDPKLSKKKIGRLIDEELEKGRLEGYTPVVVPCALGDRDLLLESISYRLEDGFDIETELKKPLEDGKSVLEARAEAFSETYGISVKSMLAQAGDGFDGFDSSAGEETYSGLQVSSMYGESRLILIKLPTVNPWEAAIYIPFGGFNECPEPSEMAAVLKYWYEKYGAVPAVITFDTLDCRLTVPIPEADADAVLEEMAIFDIDIVEMIMMSSPEGFKKALTESHIWSFWWD
ncbi:MAG: DUF4253 domain-containing protein [Clostridia bacterium]|nr:DUF4253 domain-containing protein [Clostridia bacterium]